MRAFPRRLFNIQALDGVSVLVHISKVFLYLTPSSSSRLCFHSCCPNVLVAGFMQHTFPSRQFSPKSETALLGPIALGSKSLAEVFRALRKLTFQGGFHGLEVVGLKRLLTIRPDYMIWANSVVYRHQPQGCSRCVYSICKYNAGPKSV